MNDGSYSFYNSIQHFACRISELDLTIFNLIYKYKDLNIILMNIEKSYHVYINDIYNKVTYSKLLEIDRHEDRKETVYQLPTTFYLHLTYKCNLGCIYCYNKDIRKNSLSMSLDEWCKIIDMIIPLSKHIVLTGGEPFLYENLCDVVNYIRKKNTDVYIEIISNCMIDFKNIQNVDFIFSNINSISFSCDSLSSENQPRKNFDPWRFVENIKYVKSKYSRLKITISSVYANEMEMEIQNIHNFAMSVSVLFKSVLMIPSSLKEVHLLPDIENYKKSLCNKDAKLPSKRLFCGAGIGTCSIDPIGNLYPCQNMHYKKFCYGNLLENNLMNLLQTDTSQKIRTLYNIDNIVVCKNCNVKYICAGGCRGATLKLEGDPMNYPNTLCKYYRELAISRLRHIPWL